MGTKGEAQTTRVAKASTPFEQADHEGDDCHDHKDEEQDLGDADGAGSNATKAEDCGDQSDHQKTTA